ncbi:MAG TPA: sigma-70 family RNA polymerase sigma factor [Candidatus Limnocylindria bacterium]|nr:sigma-70 family RNA polymerase sigma factor [Candidatus Limnocylindria bacterium]
MATPQPDGDASSSENALRRARAGDEDTFRELTEPHRRELQLHCYRILGSLQDAEDQVQETLLAAWRGLKDFEGRASLRAWLYRIATNRCLNTLRAGSRRPEEVRPVLPEPTRRVEPIWLEPYPDALLEGQMATAPGAEARYEMRESVALSFVAALQHLPPYQRAVLVLRDVLGFHTAEVAGMLESSDASVKGALQRARATLEARVPPGSLERAPLPGSAVERELAERFAAAFERGDTDTIVSLLTDDARLTMPPEPHEYEGPAAIAEFIHDRARVRRAYFRVVPTRANGQPAFGCYLPDAHAAIARAYGLFVLTLTADRISALSYFAGSALFPYFGLPRTLPRP